MPFGWNNSRQVAMLKLASLDEQNLNFLHWPIQLIYLWSKMNYGGCTYKRCLLVSFYFLVSTSFLCYILIFSSKLKNLMILLLFLTNEFVAFSFCFLFCVVVIFVFFFCPDKKNMSFMRMGIVRMTISLSFWRVFADQGFLESGFFHLVGDSRVDSYHGQS